VYGVFQTFVICNSVSSRWASSIAVSFAFSAVGEPSVASITGLMTSLLCSHVATEAARELSVRLLGLGQVSRLLETLPRLEEIAGQIAVPDVDAKTLDEAVASNDGTARFPKCAELLRARLGLSACRETQCARLGFDLAHASSVDLRA